MKTKRVFEIAAEVLVFMVVYAEKRSEIDHRLTLCIKKEINIRSVGQNLLRVHTEFT